MSSRSTRRLAPCLLVAALAMPVPAVALSFDPQALLGHLRGFLVAIWAGEDASARTNGCELDPSGVGCAPVSRTNGCEVDPNGVGCSQVLRDNGCEFDPNGHCVQ